MKLPFNHLIIKYMNYTKQQIMELIKQKEEEEINELIDFTKSNIFTPNEISQLMSEQLYNNGSLLEPAVGTGNLLIHLNFDNYESIDLCDINQEFLNECPNHLKITKFNNDFLKKNFSKKYKNIILNPPYIKIQDLPETYRNYIRETWPILNSGNIDIYYAFLLKCIDLLEEDGIMVAIIPNSYLYTKSALKLRKYLLENQFITQIIDFQSEKVFDSVSTYCCITTFTKQKNETILYIDHMNDSQKTIPYNEISNHEYNIFNKKNSSGKTLGDICTIKGGIATLRDAIFIHEKKLYSEPCWKKITNSIDHKWIIFPYNENGSLICEEDLKKNNPKTYSYLLENKEELLQRDKGKQDKYPSWYCFGRTQALIKSSHEKVIYTPTFVDPNDIRYVSMRPEYHFGCLCIEILDNKYTRGKIIDILEKNKQYIIENSTKRGGGWLNISSRVLKGIPIH